MKFEGMTDSELQQLKKSIDTELADRGNVQKRADRLLAAMTEGLSGKVAADSNQLSEADIQARAEKMLANVQSHRGRVII
jgi:hypothetical protein